jgi:hypothetical protein
MSSQELTNLQEIALPEPVRYIPQTIAWYILFTVVFLVLIWIGLRWYRRYLRNRYRGEVLDRLEDIQRDLRVPAKRVKALRTIPSLIKQTTLAIASREKIAGLFGERWLSYLDSTFSGSFFTEGTGQLLPRLAYRSDEDLQKISDQEVSDLITVLKKWARRHHAGI